MKIKSAFLFDIPIKKKLILMSLLVAGVSLLLSGIVIIITEVYTFRDAYIDGHAVQAKMIGYNCSAALLFNDKNAAKNVLLALKNNPEVVYAAVYMKDGSLLAEYRRDKASAGSVIRKTKEKGYSFGLNYFTLYQSIIFDSEDIGSIFIQSDLRGLYTSLMWEMASFITVILGSFLVAYLLISKLQQLISRPMGSLVDLMDRISREKNYSLRSNIQSKDEIGMLAEGFNEMLSQIRERDGELEQYSKFLENLVEQRTAEISRINEQLRTELLEHQETGTALRASLEEKEVLLKEIHHRVKNNMQIISSLLDLQSEEVKEAQTLDTFKNCIGRIKTMALIHEKLYKSKDLSRIDFSDYIYNLADQLFATYQVSPDRVKLRIHVDEVYLGINAAIPCGLIINELVSNSLKYAFQGDKGGEIEVGVLRMNDNASVDAKSHSVYALIVKDDGIGLPMSIDIKQTKSLGLRLVNSLVLQLGGTLQLLRDNGTEFRITFSMRD